jgi:plasmid stability protein
MVSFTIKGLPEGVHRKLKERARNNHRSLNSEVIACLEASVASRPIQVDDFLVRIGQIRRQVGGHLTDRQLEELKSGGRP